MGHQGQGARRPAWELLGGRGARPDALYGWIGGDRPDEVGAAAEKARRRGFTAVKMNATAELHYMTPSGMWSGGGAARRGARRPGPTSARRLPRPRTPRDGEAARPRARAARPAVPRGAGAARATRGAARDRSTHHVPIACGERLYTRWGFKDVLDAGGSSTSSSPTSPTPAASWRRARSPRWPRRTTCSSPRTARSARSRSRLRSSSTLHPQRVHPGASLRIHYNEGADLLDYVLDPSVFAHRRRHVACRRGRAWAWTSTRSVCGRRPAGSLGAARCGATKTGRWLNGEEPGGDRDAVRAGRGARSRRVRRPRGMAGRVRARRRVRGRHDRRGRPARARGGDRAGRAGRGGGLAARDRPGGQAEHARDGRADGPALAAGAHAVAAYVPWFYPVTQVQLRRHFLAVLEAAGDQPAFMYNIPPRTVNDLDPALAGELAAAGFAGMKDSTGDFARHEAYLNAVNGHDFELYTGTEPLLLRSVRARLDRLDQRARQLRAGAVRAAARRARPRRRRRGRARAGRDLRSEGETRAEESTIVGSSAAYATGSPSAASTTPPVRAHRSREPRRHRRRDDGAARPGRGRRARARRLLRLRIAGAESNFASASPGSGCPCGGSRGSAPTGSARWCAARWQARGSICARRARTPRRRPGSSSSGGGATAARRSTTARVGAPAGSRRPTCPTRAGGRRARPPDRDHDGARRPPARARARRRPARPRRGVLVTFDPNYRPALWERPRRRGRDGRCCRTSTGTSAARTRAARSSTSGGGRRDRGPGARVDGRAGDRSDQCPPAASVRAHAAARRPGRRRGRRRADAFAAGFVLRPASGLGPRALHPRRARDRRPGRSAAPATGRPSRASTKSVTCCPERAPSPANCGRVGRRESHRGRRSLEASLAFCTDKAKKAPGSLAPPPSRSSPHPRPPAAVRRRATVRCAHRALAGHPIHRRSVRLRRRRAAGGRARGLARAGAGAGAAGSGDCGRRARVPGRRASVIRCLHSGPAGGRGPHPRRTSSAGRGSPSTATTTSTGWHPRLCSCARCAR